MVEIIRQLRPAQVDKGWLNLRKRSKHHSTEDSQQFLKSYKSRGQVSSKSNQINSNALFIVEMRLATPS